MAAAVHTTHAPVADTSNTAVVLQNHLSSAVAGKQQANQVVNAQMPLGVMTYLDQLDGQSAFCVCEPQMSCDCCHVLLLN